MGNPGKKQDVTLESEGRQALLAELAYFAAEHAVGSERRLALEALLARWGQDDRLILKGSDVIDDVAVLPCADAIRMSIDVKVRECFGRHYIKHAAASVASQDVAVEA